MDSISDLADRLARERPRPPDVTDTLVDLIVDLIEAALSPDRALSAPEASETHLKALDAHIERIVAAYLRTVEIVG